MTTKRTASKTAAKTRLGGHAQPRAVAKATKARPPRSTSQAAVGKRTADQSATRGKAKQAEAPKRAPKRALNGAAKTGPRAHATTSQAAPLPRPAARAPAAAFCRQCGSTTRPQSGGMHRLCTNAKCEAVDWVNPIPAVGLAFIQDGHVLLCRRAQAPRKGQWDLVGGFIEAGETPEQAMEREALEETGCALANVRTHDIQPGAYDGRPTINFLMTGDLVGTPRPQDDVGELHFHPLRQLPMMAWPHEQAFLLGLAPR